MDDLDFYDILFPNNPTIIFTTVFQLLSPNQGLIFPAKAQTKSLNHQLQMKTKHLTTAVRPRMNLQGIITGKLYQHLMSLQQV